MWRHGWLSQARQGSQGRQGGERTGAEPPAAISPLPTPCSPPCCCCSGCPCCCCCFSGWPWCYRSWARAGTEGGSVTRHTSRLAFSSARPRWPV